MSEHVRQERQLIADWYSCVEVCVCVYVCFLKCKQSIILTNIKQQQIFTGTFINVKFFIQ